jgi:hypothetical protein
MNQGDQKKTEPVSVYSMFAGASYFLSAALCALTGFKIGQFGRIIRRTEELEQSADANQAYIKNAHAFLRAHGIPDPCDAKKFDSENQGPPDFR